MVTTIARVHVKMIFAAMIFISALSVLSNIMGLFSGCYLVWKKTGDFKGEYTKFLGREHEETLV
jgi:hypothetical protein